MEQPHNTVLLICTSHDEGYKPFICDTSYRHSNCLDQYKKSFDASLMLSCPLCRGVIFDSKIVQKARKYLNTKERNCSKETCGFSGAYGELRKHARKDHPFVRPSEVDYERQKDWLRLELQRDFADLVSLVESVVEGWDESLDFDDDGGEVGSFFALPTITFLLILRQFHGVADDQLYDDVNDENDSAQ